NLMRGNRRGRTRCRPRMAVEAAPRRGRGFWYRRLPGFLANVQRCVFPEQGGVFRHVRENPILRTGGGRKLPHHADRARQEQNHLLDCKRTGRGRWLRAFPQERAAVESLRGPETSVKLAASAFGR